MLESVFVVVPTLNAVVGSGLHRSVSLKLERESYEYNTSMVLSDFGGYGYSIAQHKKLYAQEKVCS